MSPPRVVLWRGGNGGARVTRVARPRCAAVDTFDNARDFMIGIYLVGFGAFGVVTEFLYLCVAAASRRGLLSGLSFPRVDAPPRSVGPR